MFKEINGPGDCLVGSAKNIFQSQTSF